MAWVFTAFAMHSRTSAETGMLTPFSRKSNVRYPAPTIDRSPPFSRQVLPLTHLSRSRIWIARDRLNFHSRSPGQGRNLNG